MFLSEYLMFLFKTLTIVGSIIFIIIVYFYIKARIRKSKDDGLLIVKDLSRHYYELKLQMLKTISSKHKIKDTVKEFKKVLKGKKLLRLTLFGIICPILNAYYEKLFDIKYLASLELRHGSAQLNI